jgi:hypothetical protein
MSTEVKTKSQQLENSTIEEKPHCNTSSSPTFGGAPHGNTSSNPTLGGARRLLPGMLDL